MVYSRFVFKALLTIGAASSFLAAPVPKDGAEISAPASHLHLNGSKGLGAIGKGVGQGALALGESAVEGVADGAVSSIFSNFSLRAEVNID